MDVVSAALTPRPRLLPSLLARDQARGKGAMVSLQLLSLPRQGPLGAHSQALSTEATCAPVPAPLCPAVLPNGIPSRF